MFLCGLSGYISGSRSGQQCPWSGPMALLHVSTAATVRCVKETPRLEPETTRVLRQWQWTGVCESHVNFYREGNSLFAKLFNYTTYLLSFLPGKSKKLPCSPSRAETSNQSPFTVWWHCDRSIWCFFRFYIHLFWGNLHHQWFTDVNNLYNMWLPDKIFLNYKIFPLPGIERMRLKLGFVIYNPGSSKRGWIKIRIFFYMF